MSWLSALWQTVSGERTYQSRLFQKTNQAQTPKTYLKPVAVGNQILYDKRNYVVPMTEKHWFSVERVDQQPGMYGITRHRRWAIDPPYKDGRRLNGPSQSDTPVTTKDGRSVFDRATTIEIINKLEQSLAADGFHLAPSGQPKQKSLPANIPIRSAPV